MNDTDFSWFEQWFAAMVNTVGGVIKGKPQEVGMVVLALFAEGHVLLEDFPGTGKTTLAKSLASCIRAEWNRVQFTPDLLPADVTGSMIFRPNDGAFDFRPGPVFANVVLADEINRASPKTQSSLLQVMEEREVTVDGVTHSVPRPFVVLATQNPIEQEGTYRLPEAQLDRFMIKLSLGYPGHDAEVEMLKSVGSGRTPGDIEAIVSAQEIGRMIAAVKAIHLEDQLCSYIARLCAFTRSELSDVRLGVSPRGAVALMAMSKAMAGSQGRSYVSVDDVRRVAPYVMGHRLLLTPTAELSRVSVSDLITRTVDTVEAPHPVRS